MLNGELVPKWYYIHEESISYVVWEQKSKEERQYSECQLHIKKQSRGGYSGASHTGWAVEKRNTIYNKASCKKNWIPKNRSHSKIKYNTLAALQIT